MAFTSSTFRSDLQTVVEEARSADQMFIGEKIMPFYGVSESTGQYPKFKLADGRLLDAAAPERNLDGSFNEITREYEADTYGVSDRGLEERVDDRYKADVARFYDAESTAARLTLRNVRLGHEKRVADAILNASNFTATAASVNYTESNIATINFAKDIQAAIARLEDKGVMANTIVMSNVLRNQIARSTLFQNFIKAFDASVNVISDRILAMAVQDAFGIQNVEIGRLSYQGSKVKGTFTASKIWSNSYIFVGEVKDGDPMQGGVGRTFFWEQYTSSPFAAFSYRDEKRKSDIVRVEQSTAEKIIDSTAGELITTNYSAS